jgi:hypothetical protein
MPSALAVHQNISILIFLKTTQLTTSLEIQKSSLSCDLGMIWELDILPIIHGNR